MSQGYARPQLTEVSMFVANSPSMDAFGRLRVSSPSFVFDSQLTYNLLPLVYEPITNGAGATVAHDSTNRCALMTFSSTPTGGKSYMQSFEYLRYQPGRSQILFLTFNFIEPIANVLKFAGLSDGSNGIELQLDGTTTQIKLYSDTTAGDQTVAQSSWNLDKLDGTGASGITLDLTKTQILVVDFQALYVGRVRVGFDIDGLVYYVHEFNHANVLAYPYIQTANLPVRCGMTCTGTVSTTMNFICASVMSGSGQIDIAGFNFSIEGTGTAASGSRTHLLSVRPKTTYNSITNRIKFILDSVEILAGANPVLYEIVLGQAISGTTTFNDVNATYSGFEYNTAGTISGSPAIVIDSGYVGSSASVRGSHTGRPNPRYPITLDAAGAVRSLGTLSVLLTGISGTSASRVSMNWHELR